MYRNDNHNCENTNDCAASPAQHRALVLETTSCRSQDCKENSHTRKKAECSRSRHNATDPNTCKCDIEHGNRQCYKG